MAKLTKPEMIRYSRHFNLPQVGVAGQQKLKDAAVLLVGAGGLGSPLALYLAAAGVGRIGIVDDDAVDATNLQRQVLHGSADVGRAKLDSARDRLRDLNPHVAIELHPARLNAANALAIIKGYDIVADGADNFPTRYLVNDACVMSGVPLVSGSILGFEGQLSVFNHAGGPCYRCLFPEPPPPGSVPSCAEGGVLGVLPGVIGCLQASEVVKLALGVGKPASGRLILYNALDLAFKELRFQKDPGCAVCGEQPSILALSDGQFTCEAPSTPPLAGTGKAIPEIKPKALHARMEAYRLLDVREPFEREICHIEPSDHLPLGELAKRDPALPKDATIVVYCKTGGRSMKAARALKKRGYQNVINLAGGVLAWVDQVDPGQAKY